MSYVPKSTPSVSERLAASRAKFAAMRPPPLPASIPLPVPPPPEKFYEILNFRLDNGRTQYLIPIRATHETPLHKATHLAILHQCGANLATTRHRLDFYTLTQLSPSVVRDIELAQKPTFSIFTKPFIFHILDAAKTEIRNILRRELEAD